MTDLKYNGYTIKIIQDEDPQNPREDDNLGTMVCFHPRYKLGDKHDYTPESLQELVGSKDVVAMPLFLLDHSGLWIRTGRFAEDQQGWDTSMVGYIFVSLKKARKEGVAADKLPEILQAEVQEYNDYLTGNVYGYQAIDKDGEQVGSCWGFIGDPGESGLLDAAKADIDADLVKNPQQLSLFPEEVTA
jgi:hypothetical protein